MPTWADFEPVEASSDSTNTWKDFEPHDEQPHLDVPKFEPPPIPPLTPEEEARAKEPWYKPPRQFEESIFGITPEGVPAGKTPLEAIGRATEKTALGAAQFATSPKGMIQIGATFTPAAPVVYAKWAWDMIKGGVASIKQAKEDLTTLITDHFTQEVAGRNNLPYYPDDPKRQQALIQSLADNAVNTAASVIGAAGAVKGGVKAVRDLIPEVQPTTPPEPTPPTFEATPLTPVPPISPGLPVVPPEAPLGEPTFAPSGLSLARPETAPQAQPATIAGTPATRALIPPTAGPEVQPPPSPLAPEYVSGKAAQAVREMGAQQLRMEDFEKAVSEKVSQEQAEPLHPDKPLTANQLRIIKDSLVNAIEQNQLPGSNKGIVAGSPLEAWADGVIKKSGERTRFGGIDPELAAAGVVKGAALLERGVTEFTRWSSEMIKAFGEKIKPHLRTLFDQSKGLRYASFEKAQEGGAGVQSRPETLPELQAEPIKNPAVQKAKQKLDIYRGGIVSAVTARPERHAMDQTFSAADNQARILGRSTANHVSIGTSDIEQKAASAVIASGFDKEKLGELLSGKNKDADAAIKYAQDNWEKVVPIAERGKEVFDNTYMDLNNHSIPVEYAENYLPGLVDTDVWMGQGRPYVIRGRGGSGAPGTTGFQKGKTYPTPFDAIKDGQTVKSIKLSELVENYVTNAQKLMNRAEWADSLRDVKDPNNQQPIVTSLIKHVRGEGRPAWEAPPTGYVRRTVLPGVDIAVHEGYARLFDALTGRSVIAEFEPGGIPVGVAALQGAGFIKHGLLAFDTFHASRILQKYAFLTGQLLSSKKGLALLDYADRDLDRAVAAKEITPEIADYVRQNRPTADLLIKNGLPVGRIQQALYTTVVRKIPIIGAFNKWVFEKATRSAIMQAGLLEFERVKKSNPELSETAVAQKVSRDLGAYFGNLDKQGIFKSATLNDLSHLIWMAPQWVEAMARSEVGGAVQLGKGLANPLMGQAIKVGTLGAGLGKGLIAYFLATQLLNLATRKQFTWQNQEEGHKLDAWIPDITGKTPGYFISPFSVVAELTHDAIRYSQTEPDALAVAGRILANKSSSLVRAARALGGRDWNDQKLVGSWNKVKAAAWALAPTPIPLQPIVKGAPAGQAQRQLTSSLGFKTEPAPTAQQQIYSLVDRWKAQNRDPRYRRQLERKEAEQRAPSDYKPLKQALINRDQKTAEQEYTKLRESGKTLDQIQREFESPRPFTGSSSGDTDFKKTLTPQQRELFRAAETERKELAQKFKEMLRKRP